MRIIIGAIAVRDLNGLDATGAPVAIGAGRSGGIALFVLRARTARADCRYWNDVSALLKRARAKVAPVAFCDEPGCDAACPSHSFPVISYAEIVVMERAYLLSRDGSVLVIGPRGQALMRSPWWGRPASVVAQEIDGAQD